MRVLWGLLGAAFVGTGVGFLRLDPVVGLGAGVVLAGLWCFVLAMASDMNFGGAE